MMLLTVLGKALAVTVAAWNPAGLTSYGPSPWGATTSDPNITVTGLTRGGGVLLSGSGAGNAWGGVNWAGADMPGGISAGSTATFTIHANTGYNVSLTTLNLYYRRSGTGPGSGELQYSIDGTTFVNVAAFAYTSTGSSGAALPAVDLSGITNLQNVPATTTVTFRIVNWGGGTGGTWYVFNAAGLSVTGTVNTASGCSGTPTAGTTSASASSLCVSGASTLTLTGATVGTGIGYQWYSSPTGVAGSFTSISGATNTTYTTPTISSTTYYQAVTTCSTSGSSATAPATAVTVNPLPAAISGTASVCAGGTTTLSTTSTGGTWSSSSTAAATVGTGGVVNGIGAGNPYITYTLPTGCYTTQIVTVNSVAATVAVTPATATMCAGATPQLLTASGNSFGGAGTYYSTGSQTTSTGITAVLPVSVSGIPAGATITGASLMFNGVQSAGGWDSDDIINLQAPNGNILNLVYEKGGSSSTAGFANTNISSSGSTAVPATGAPYTGTYAADAMSAVGPAAYLSNVTAWSGLYGTPNGTWNFIGYFSYAGATTFSSITLTLTYTFPGSTTWADTTGLYTDAAGTTGYTGSVTTTVYAQPATTTTYTVTAAGGACTSAASSAVNVNPLPVVQTTTGGGSYCSGGTGVHIGLSNSETGVNYQLYNGATAIGSAVAGTGTALDFGLFTTATTYSVVATNATTSCTSNMTGAVTISVNPLPAVYAVSGGGTICAGDAGPHITLSASDAGINYQLYNGATAVGTAIAGTGAALDFCAQTTAGTYSVVATHATTSCTSNMTGTAIVVVNPLPTAYTMTGGGALCTGGTGYHVGLSGSDAGVNYQLYNGATAVGTAVAGTGAALDFGVFTTAGTYSVQATNATTSCPAPMTGAATIAVYALPVVHNMTGGGNYCSGGIGVHVGIDGSETGVNYQLYNGATTVGTAVAGTGSALDFGLQTPAGTYTVIATNATTLCTSNMAGTSVIVINPLPTAHAVTGGGSYCATGTGVHIGLDNADAGINYQLYNGSTTVGTAVAGTGAALDFGLQTTAGAYSVSATNATTGCTNGMTGTVTISINPLPVAHNVTGGGHYCSGGAGVHVGLDNSEAGVNYQLYNGAVTVGTATAGTGVAIDFGLQASAGTYSVVATNTTTGCTTAMTGTAIITVDPLPTVYTVTGGGTYCSGGAGFNVGMNGSDAGINYQLYNGSTAVGTAVAGTGAAIDFGTFTTSGTYSVVATNATTGCVSNMAGAATIAITPLPGVHTVTGGGNYCSGGAGVHIGLNGSETGVNYQLYNGTTTVGTAIAGTGAALDFGLQTAAGTYTVVATNATSGCTNNMAGSATVVINPLPTAYTMTGGGSYCAGSTGLHMGLNGSNTGINYQLYNGATVVGTSVAGTGAAIDFGVYTASGTYSVLATNATTSCTAAMTGTSTITINPLPTAYTVNGGGNYCSGGTGVHVGLNGSGAGVNYQLYRGATAVGTAVAGTGAALDFGLFTTAGTYSVSATNATTGCTKNMTGTVTVSVNPLPAAHTVTGGGNYCSGGTGVHTGLNGSNTGTTYQLYNGAATVGSPVAGTGAAIDFGLQTAAGTYTVLATITATGCTLAMAGSATITINPLPGSFTVTGGGGYCAGGAGVHIGLSGSAAGISYQLYNGATTAGTAVSGAGAAIDFGVYTATGTYTVLATNTATGCTRAMPGSTTITINPLPGTFNATGGGAYCSGGAGVHIGLDGSATGINYQLYDAATAMGTAVAGSGSAIDFGLQTTAGTYIVLATNATTGCIMAMTGSASVIINSLPVAQTVTGGGAYCAGGAGVDVGLASSVTGINYQLYVGTSAIGSPVAGTGTAIDFGMQTIAGTYSVSATNTVTGCTNAMTGTATVIINPLLTPTVTVTTSSATDTVCSGTEVIFTATPANGGTTPAYSWMVNGTAAGTGADTLQYTPLNGDVISVVLTSSYVCATPDTAADTVQMVVITNVMPSVTITAAPGTTVCAGTPVTFTAVPVNGGIVPFIRWTTNDTNVATGPAYTNTFSNGDKVHCMMRSAYGCTLADSVFSDTLTLTVQPMPAPPVLGIIATPGLAITAGQTDTFTATVGGGAAVLYQWFKNGVPIAGATNGTYITNMLANEDTITCAVVTAEACALHDSLSVVVMVDNTGVGSWSRNTNVSVFPNPSTGTFTVKGDMGTVSGVVTIEISNMPGQTVYHQDMTISNGKINERIQLPEDVANGMYLLRLHSGSDVKIFTVMIGK